MKNLYLLLFISATFTFINCKTEIKRKNTTTVLIGEVIGRDSSKVISLTNFNQNWNVNPAEIPIENGKFQYTLVSNEIQQFKLAFNDELELGSWMPIKFYNDKDTIRFKLHKREDYLLNEITNTALNIKEKNLAYNGQKLFYNQISKIYKTKVDSLEKIKKWETQEVQKIWEDYDDAKNQSERYKRYRFLVDNKKDLTSEGRYWQNKIDSISNKYYEYKSEIIANDNTIFGYSKLLERIQMRQSSSLFDINFIEKEYNNYKMLFPNHSYNTNIETILNGIQTIKIGGFYADFSSTTFDEKTELASKIVDNNKLTLIDLWMTWCAPCISKHKKIRPIYDDYKKKGLKVYSVLSIGSREKYLETEKKYNYPWQLNYELDQKFNIWNKYNLSNSAGSQFLVNSKGKILAINPEPKEIDSILNTMSKIKL